MTPDAMMGRDEYAEIEAACLATLGGQPTTIPWKGRRASAVMATVEVVVTDRGWSKEITAFADRDGILLRRSDSED